MRLMITVMVMMIRIISPVRTCGHQHRRRPNRADSAVA
jgi:hypothetical protein